MHDTFLLKRISDALYELCHENKIVQVKKLRIITSQNSHLGKENLYEHLKMQPGGLVGDWTEILVDKQDIESLTAVIDSIEGEVIKQ